MRSFLPFVGDHGDLASSVGINLGQQPARPAPLPDSRLHVPLTEQRVLSPIVKLSDLHFPGRVLDAERCESSTIARDQSAPKMPVTIGK